MSDNLIPLDRTFSPKEMKIAGWSSNLLENASAEVRLGDSNFHMNIRARLGVKLDFEWHEI